MELRGRDIGKSPVFESTAWYFRIDGRMFKAMVLYWQADPKADELNQTLKQVVLSFRIEP